MGHMAYVFIVQVNFSGYKYKYFSSQGENKKRSHKENGLIFLETVWPHFRTLLRIIRGLFWIFFEIFLAYIKLVW